MKTFRVVRPGLFTTVQDQGRTRASRWGVPVSGCADPLSASAANAVAGNGAAAALLEATLGPIEIEALVETALGIAGAASVSVNGEPANARETVYARRGDRVVVGAPSEGFRVYVAFAGGIDVPLVLGSRSTLASAGFGGFRGRKLSAGDELETFEASLPERRALPSSMDGPIPDEVRVLPGPQRDRFSESSLRRFFDGTFRVSSRSDRRGLRLEGEGAPPSPGEIAPEGVVFGAVQVPPGGEPIVLMPDGPVTGGYPKIAVVIRADLPVLGQSRPGRMLRFRDVTREEAIEAWKTRCGA